MRMLTLWSFFTVVSSVRVVRTATANQMCSPRSGSVTMSLPSAVRTLLPEAVKQHAIFAQAAESNWMALRACYPSEEAALAAVTECRPVLLPYGADSLVSGFYELGLAVDRSTKVGECFEVLKQKLNDDAEVLEVITKNPGVLGCVPEALEKQSSAEIRRFAALAGGLNGFFGPARRMAESSSSWDEGVASPRERGEDEAVELPEVVLEGNTYLYDFFGQVMGVEQLLLTEEGEPVAVWNPETQEVELAEFVDEDDSEGDDEVGA